MRSNDTFYGVKQVTFGQRLQNHMCEIFNEILEMQVFTPITYSAIMMISFVQQLYFLLYDAQLSDDHGELKKPFDLFLRYLPVFPEIFKSQMMVLYVITFISLFAVIIAFFVLLILHIWLEERRKLSKSKPNQKLSIQTSNNMKIVLRIASIYLVLHKELLTIPSYVFIFDIFQCKDGQPQSSQSSSSIVNVSQPVHQTSGIECWSSFFSVLFIIGVLHLVLLLILELLKFIYLNDAFYESKVPWTQFTIKPQVVNMLINIGYSLQTVLDTPHSKKYIMDILCLLLSVTILLFRIVFPLYQSNLIKKVTIAIESSRAIISLYVVIHVLFNINLNAFSLTLEIIICFLFIMIFYKATEYRIKRILMRGIKHIKSQDQFQMYVYKISELVAKDEKRNNFYLQGILQTHLQECSDCYCPCKESSDLKSERFQFHEDLFNSRNSYRNSIISMHNTTGNRKQEFQQNFMAKFQLRKASLVHQIQKKQEQNLNYLEIDQHKGDNYNKNFHSQQWYNLLKYQFKKKLSLLKQSIKLRYTISCFYFLQLKNEFKALFELIVIEEDMPKFNTKFLIFRLKKRIEKIIQQKHEKQASMTRKINIIQVYEYERNFQQFQKLILRTTILSMKFWSELLEKDLNAVRIHSLGIKISKNNQLITGLGGTLTSIYPNQVKMLMMYSRYLNDVLNNEFNASDQFQRAINQRINFRQNLKINENNEEMLFGENAFCSIFVLSTEIRKLGYIDFCNHEVEAQYGWKPEDLTGKDINLIIPKMIAVVHSNLMLQFFEKAESTVLNKVRELFAKDKNGYLIPIYLFSKVLPSLTGGLKMVGVTKTIQVLTFEPEVPAELAKLDQEYIICDKENNIQNFSYGMTLEFGLFPKMFQNVNGNTLFDQDVNIEALSHDFIDKQQEMQNFGSLITINTATLFQRVEREVLTNEEFNFFQQKQGQIKVFCQMAKINFHNIVEINIYRLIQFEKINAQKITQSQSLSQGIIDERLFESGFNLNSSNSQSSQNSSICSIDRQIKDFKKQITENNEPSQLQRIKKLVKFLLAFIILTSSLIFYYHLDDESSNYNSVNSLIRKLKFQNDFIEMQQNLRSILDIANSLEYGYKKLSPLPYSDRFSFLNNKSLTQLDNIKDYLEDFHQFENDGIVKVKEINSKGVIYEYQVQTRLAFDQYVSKAVDLIGRNYSSLQTSVIKQNFSTTQSITFSDTIVATSAFYVLNMGYRELIPFIKKNIQDNLEAQKTFQSASVLKIRWLGFISVLFIIIGKILLIIVIQIIENNKVIVLSLYSEIKISHVKESLQKSKIFFNNLLNVKDEEEMSLNDLIQQQEDMVFLRKRGEPVNLSMDFIIQWRKFNERLQFFRINDQKEAIEKLQKNLLKLSIQQNNQFIKKTEEDEFELIIQQNQRKEKVIDFASLMDDQAHFKSNLTFQDPLSVGRRQSDINSSRSGSVSTANHLLEQRRKNNKKKSLLQQKSKFKQQVASQFESKLKVVDEHKQLESISLSEGASKSIEEESKDQIEVQKNEIDSNNGEDADQKVGKYEQFSKIKKKNWRQVIILVLLTLMLLGYYAFSYFFQVRTQIDTQEYQNNVKLSYFRFAYTNILFGYMRERLILQDTSFLAQETEILNAFYDNEYEISKRVTQHKNTYDFFYQFISDIDTSQFCSDNGNTYNQTVCNEFYYGVLSQGYKQALFSYIKYYTQYNVSAQKTNFTQSMVLLNNLDIQSFYVASETIFDNINTIITNKWQDHINTVYTNYKEAIKAVFIVFLLLLLFVEALVIPKIIQQLNETTWRSRGILNLVPNEVIRELRQNSRILQLFKN